MLTRQMLHGDAFGLLLGAVALGAIHGIEPGHGWPVAASYALDQTNKWLYGIASSFILGIGHLISSIAMVGVFFYAKSYFTLTQVNDPIRLSGDIVIGGPVSVVAGVLLILLGVREYRHDHSHNHAGHSQEHEYSHDDAHDHGHADQGSMHSHDDPTDRDSLWARMTERIPVVGEHSHNHGDHDGATDRGLWGIAWFAFLLGFAHEEEFEIIALCAGSTYCLELMTVYAVTVIVGIIGMTLVLITGYQHFEERVKRYTPYLPIFSAAVLIIMGVGFITNVF